jgi:hypothetical protein
VEDLTKSLFQEVLLVSSESRRWNVQFDAFTYKSSERISVHERGLLFEGNHKIDIIPGPLHGNSMSSLRPEGDTGSRIYFTQSEETVAREIKDVVFLHGRHQKGGKYNTTVYVDIRAY